MLKGFRRFLMQGDLIVIAVGLVVALAFSTLIKSFTDHIITPLVNAAGGKGAVGGLGWTINGSRINLGGFIADVIYFVIFMAVIYFLLVVPYRAYMRKRARPSSVTRRRPRPARTASRPTCPSTRPSACTAPAISPPWPRPRAVLALQLSDCGTCSMG